MYKTLLAAAGAMALAPSVGHATILTFDVAGGASNHGALAQTYGDNVSSSPDAAGHAYGFGAEGATPHIALSYGQPGEAPALWTTGYGNLTNIYFNDTDSDATFTTTLTADSGWLVDLYSFDLASFVNAGQTVQGIKVTDLATSAILFAQGPTAISGSTSTPFSFSTPLTGTQLQILVDLTGLGGASDDIGMDNIRFGEHLAPPPPSAAPEPQTWATVLLGLFAAGAALRAGRRRKVALA